MATTNLNLNTLAGTEKLKSFPTPYNDNMGAIDGAFGSGFGVGNNSSVDDELNGLGKGMAIIANGNTHAAITSGQYVYVRQHGSLSEGLYQATANISANGTLSGSNLTAVSSGGLNDVYSSLNSKITQNVVKVTNCNDATDPLKNYYCEGNTTNAPSTGWWFIRVLNVSANYITQIATQMNSLASKIVIRTTDLNGTWGSWQLISRNVISESSSALGVNGTFQIPNFNSFDSFTITARRYGYASSVTIARELIANGAASNVIIKCSCGETNDTKISISSTGLITISSSPEQVFIGAICH